MSIASLFGAGEGPERPNELPTNQHSAFLLACVFRRLGGFLSIDSTGTRRVGRPCYFEGELPQLPNAEPHERFHSRDEWEGAIKLVEALLRRMSDEDRDFLFLTQAADAIDPRKLTPSIEEPKRRSQ